MTEKEKSEKMSCTLGGLLFLALTGVQVWYMDGFLPRAGQIIFSIIGGLLLQTVVFQLIRVGVSHIARSALSVRMESVTIERMIDA